MARPRWVVGNSAEQAWRSVPMPDSNLPLAMVPLHSDPSELGMLAEFPPGFMRDGSGGYRTDECFYVVSGAIEIGDLEIRRGQLTYVPAHVVRSGMRSPSGCRVLAWFGGPADYLPREALEPTEEQIVTVELRTVEAGVALRTPRGEYVVVAGDRCPEGAEAFDPDTGSWSRTPEDWLGQLPRRLVARPGGRRVV